MEQQTLLSVIQSFFPADEIDRLNMLFKRHVRGIRTEDSRRFLRLIKTKYPRNYFRNNIAFSEVDNVFSRKTIVGQNPEVDRNFDNCFHKSLIFPFSSFWDSSGLRLLINRTAQAIDTWVKIFKKSLLCTPFSKNRF